MVKRLDFDPALRLALAQQVLAALKSAVPGSTAELRGSLATGNADPYSDVDLLWEIPDQQFTASAARMEAILSSVQRLESLRSDPDLQDSSKHRLIFAQFAGMPLFWRMDIELFARSIHRDAGYDLHNEAARGEDWSPTHSALMNAVAAIKADLRNQHEVAQQLLVRGFERVGLDAPQGSTPELVLTLCEVITGMDPSKKDLAQRIVELHHQVFH